MRNRDPNWRLPQHEWPPETASAALASLLKQRFRNISVCLICPSDGSKELTHLSDNACDPQNFEPNLALNLEVADLINSKKGNAYALITLLTEQLLNF